jgi:hypothetical protein
MAKEPEVKQPETAQEVYSGDAEIEEYRRLMERPTQFEDGFGIKAVLGGFFIALVMIPGSIYLGLVAGQGLGPAAEWVTVILFAEIARRSLTQLKRNEIYILYYLAGSLVSFQAGVAISGGAFGWLVWSQYLRQSPPLQGLGVSENIPGWVSPLPISEAILQRNLFHPDWWRDSQTGHWLGPIVLIFIGSILGLFNKFGLGYALFRLTSDVERLPYPMAPVAAQGATALAEATSGEETWRWRVFSIGSMIGMVFGGFYVGIPALTGAVMQKPLQLISIPWIDLTPNTESFLKATPTGIGTSLGTFLVGFVLPFWAVVGGFVAAMLTIVLNPILYSAGVLHTWRPGYDTITTNFVNQVDFWMSAGIGVSLAVGVIGIVSIAQTLMQTRQNRAAGPRRAAPPPGRGDYPMWIALAMYAVSTLAYIYLCRLLVPKFSTWYLLFFGFIFTPFNSYIHARMTGLTGQYAGIPMVKEGIIILSGYKGIDIWFAPLPYHDFGGIASSFRVVELTGNKITSIIKAELFMLPLLLACSAGFWWFMWKLAPIPSAPYPYAQKMWHMQALQNALWWTATQKGENSLFFQAIKPPIITGGLTFGLLAFGLLSWFRLPTLLVYGFIRGMGSLPHFIIPEMIGALIGRYYFAKRFGSHQWKLYATVLLAGFSCGMGLVGMGSAAVAMIFKSVSQMPF